MQEDLISSAKEFFEYYKKEIGKFAREGKKCVQVSFQELVSFSPELSEQLLHNPEEVLAILELALEETGLITNARVRISDMPETQAIRIRNLRAKHLSKFITIEGIVRQASEVRPKVTNAKFECPSCGTILSVLQLDESFREPVRCGCGRKGSFKLISKEMVDAQRLVVEESSENLVGGEQPRRLNVFLKEDLVDPSMEGKTTPGSKIKVIGVLKEIPIPTKTGKMSTRFEIAIEANNVIPLEEVYDDLDISEEDERQIKELAADPNLYTKLKDSIAPSVFGHDEIKEALVLQLFSGVKKIRSDGTSGRGDMHILLVGDPGVAKSVLLKFISTIAPKARYLSGKATTSAGLTATVVKDEFMRSWSLEAGAMVLANKGICCIDEIEDMAEEDRSSMHEAMEQQTVTISKATVQATLRAETSVLAAGNPKYGRFDLYQPIAQQINIDAALLNRFDLIFVLKDLPERIRDEAIATHILLEKRSITTKRSIEPQLLRKYIAYAKQKISPELTDKAVEEIKNFYVDLRNKPLMTEQLVKPIPITARQLEALIRLAEANAKVRLSKKITKDDARKAIELLKVYLSRVGFDYETKTIDIDKISTGIPASQKSKIILVREAIIRLESRLGKLIPTEEIFKELGDKIDIDALDEVIEKLAVAGDVFKPKKGYIQRVG